ncbi:MAG: hypothetical protein Fues2KO_08610 [Fuerstiella sp.]
MIDVCRSFTPLLLLVAFSSTAEVPSVHAAETVAVREVASDTKRWDRWAQSGETVHLSGRYDGRIGRMFTLAKLNARISPGRTAVFPTDVDAGQRVTVSGVVRKEGSRYVVEATRIFAGPTDLSRLHEAARRLPNDDLAARYELADQFDPIAEFYADADLASRVKSLRLEAFELERNRLKSDPDGLIRLKQRAADLGINDSIRQTLDFQALWLRYEQATSLPEKDSDKSKQLTKLSTDIKEKLAGWDQQFDLTDPQKRKQFEQDPIQAYEAAEDFDRKKMHRRLYRRVRLQQILSDLKSDGSNGDEIAATVVLELPEEQQAVETVRKQYVDYRLQRVPFLTRKQLEDVESLLKKSNRSDEFSGVLDQWLEAQRKRLNDQQLNGMLMMADEYRFAWERWQQKRHSEGAADLLKRAWVKSVKEAPREAKKILSQLEQLGWTRLHDRWMTTDDLRSLPQDDVELALRERRVVRGMDAKQVTSILGQPTRRVKVVSGQHVQEIWLFDDGGSQPISVHMQRRRFEEPDDAVCLLVTTAVR